MCWATFADSNPDCFIRRLGFCRVHSLLLSVISRRLLSADTVIRTTGGQGVHREVESEGLAEKYRAVIEGATPG
jgi:hypothetical protein